VFALRGPLPVRGDGSPPVFPHDVSRPADGQHRFNRKRHSGFDRPRIVVSVMPYRWPGMELFPNSVTDEFIHDAEFVLISYLVNRRADSS
jgi:hypothetical protein